MVWINYYYNCQDEGILEDAPQSMYMFEGTDYSKEPTAADQKAFDELIEGTCIFYFFPYIFGA